MTTICNLQTKDPAVKLCMKQKKLQQQLDSVNYQLQKQEQQDEGLTRIFNSLVVKMKYCNKGVFVKAKLRVRLKVKLRVKSGET